MRIAFASLLIACGSAKPSKGEHAFTVASNAVQGAIAAGNVTGIAFEGIEPGMNADRAVATAATRFRTTLCSGTPVTTSGKTVHYELNDCIVESWGRILGVFDVTWEDAPTGLRAHIIAPKEVWQLTAASTRIDRLDAERSDRLLTIDTTTRVASGLAAGADKTILDGRFKFDHGPHIQGTISIKDGNLAGTVKLDYHETFQTRCPLDGSVESHIDGITITEKWKENTGPEYRPSHTVDISDGTHRESLVDCQWGSMIGPH